MMALGLIETKGLLAAIECADAMLKAANVHLLERNLASGGLVTISIAGEVGAVKASVDAAVAAVQRIKGATLISSHVIARPDRDLSCIISTQADLEARPFPEAAVAVATGGGVHAPPAAAGPVRHELSQLKKLSANSLRQIASSLNGFPMTQGEMASASKKDLIEAIIAASRQEEE